MSSSVLAQRSLCGNIALSLGGGWFKMFSAPWRLPSCDCACIGWEAGSSVQSVGKIISEGCWGGAGVTAQSWGSWELVASVEVMGNEGTVGT